MIRPRCLPVISFLMFLATAGAQAGTVASGSWSPAGCGAKPEAPSLDLRNPDAYNKSVEGVNAYRKDIRTYLNCLTQEANADIQAVTRAANAAQQAAREADDKILADVKAADAKFGK